MAAILKEVTFKNIDDGEIHSFPHNNLPLNQFKEIYSNRLLKKLNMSNSIKENSIDIIYIDDYRSNKDILEKFLNIQNIDIDDILYQYYNKCKKDNLYFYVKFNDALTFPGECIICYNESSRLNHYYNCNITNTESHHGMCNSCFNSISQTTYNVCPMCRSSCKN